MPDQPPRDPARPDAPLEELARAANAAIQQSAMTAMTAANRGTEGSLRFFLGAIPAMFVSGVVAWLVGTNPITALFLCLAFGGASGVVWSRVPWFRARYKIYLSEQEKLNDRAQLKCDAQYAAIDRARERLQGLGPLTPAHQRAFKVLEMEVLKERLETIGGATRSKTALPRPKHRKGRKANDSQPALPPSSEPPGTAHEP